MSDSDDIDADGHGKGSISFLLVTLALPLRRLVPLSERVQMTAPWPWILPVGAAPPRFPSLGLGLQRSNDSACNSGGQDRVLSCQGLDMN